MRSIGVVRPLELVLAARGWSGVLTFSPLRDLFKVPGDARRQRSFRAAPRWRPGHQMDGPPITVGRQIRAQSPALNKATREAAHAKALYRRCLEKYGTAQ